MRYQLIGILLGAALLGACRESDAPLADGRVFASSEPQGARILLDGNDTGLLTPDTLEDIGGVRNIEMQLDVGGIEYRYGVQLRVQPNSLTELHRPLFARCAQAGSAECSEFLDEHTAANLRFRTSAAGTLLSLSTTQAGLYWPAAASDDYVASAAPSFAAHEGTASLALNVYDQPYFAGRPTVSVTDNGTFRLEQRAWILPPFGQQQAFTTRGLEVHETVIASEATPDVLLIALTFRNISAEPLYQLVDAPTGAGGITFTDAYIGFAIDPDIGTPGDDWVSYDPALDAVFMYDSDFLEGSFTAGNAPGLIGLRVLRVDQGSGIVLNTWESPRDWHAATQSQAIGFGMLSGTAVFTPDHPGSEIGYLPDAPADLRMVASAGPLTLPPGDSASIVVAVALAAPEPGTFTSGQRVDPGNPDVTARPILAIATALRERLAAAADLLDLLP